METIGLIAAIPSESDALVKRVRGWKRVSIGTYNGKSIERSGFTFILVTSGMGAKRAGEAARNLVKTMTVKYLVSFGIAGAVETEMDVGDIVLVDEVCEFIDGKPSELLPLAAWADIAKQAAEQAFIQRGFHLFRGTAVTTGGSSVSIVQLAGKKHPILEMETMGIAEVVAERNIPFLAVRAISDGPCAPIPFDLGEMMDENANLRIGRLCSEITHSPRILPQLIEMRRNSQIAADNAARALMLLLDQQLANEGSPH